MLDTYQTLQQLNTLFQSLVMGILGLDPTNWNTYQANPGSWIGDVPANPYYNVRISWPTGGAPAWKINEDVCFLRVIEQDSPINKQREVVVSPFDLNNINQATGYTRNLALILTFYGPNSFENAQTVRDCLFYEINKETLALSDIYILPDIKAPQRAPENISGQWWERSDMTVYFNELIIRNITVPYIQSADITLTTVEENVDIVVSP